MKSLLLALLLGQSVVPVERGTLVITDGGVVEVKEGVWFSTPEVTAMGKDHADLRQRNEHLESHASDVPYKWVAIAAVVSFMLGGFVGAAVVAAGKK